MFSASSRRRGLNQSTTNIPSECRIANIVRDHAMILPGDATPKPAMQTPKPDEIFGKDTGARRSNDFAHSPRSDQSDSCATPGRTNRSILPGALTSPRPTRASIRAFIFVREILPVRSKKLFLLKKS